MDKRVYFFMIVSFVVGMVELIIGGILDLIAEDLSISLGQAGFLITIFSLIFAVAGPILLYLTANFERKQLTLLSLVVFLLGNIVTVFSPTFTVVLLGRVISAFSGALLIILCLVMAPSVVEPQYRGRAIGVVSMGVSGSLVLGVPIGLVLGNAFGWRAPFVLITLLTLLAMVGVLILMKRVPARPPVPIRTQLATLKNQSVLFSHMTTFFFLVGHMTLYSYLRPFLTETMGLEGTMISVVYFVFGIAAVSGGGVGGTLADSLGAKQTVLWCIGIFTLTMFAIPYTTFAVSAFLLATVVWGIGSWAITPAIQSFVIQASPETSDIQQSLNNSALHFGIAFGSFIGGIIIEQFSIIHNATFGGMLVIMSFGTAMLAIRAGKRNKFKNHSPA